ncbi:MAG: DMT family protein [Pseudomonadota bacterium]
MTASLWPRIAPVLLLLASNLFMTFAWYGHLKHKASPLVLVVLVSWMIALPEYALAVPANRIGSAVWTTAQLKTLQEVITLLVFVGFSVLYLGEPLKLSTLAGFVLIAAGAGLVFLGR